MTEQATISSLSEYMGWVSDMSLKAKEQDNHALLYRGHSDANYTLLPTAYRTNVEGKSFRAVEHQLYEDMLRREPVAFINDRTVFEKVIRMQHHGLPSRLLDLTHSPLVALYFACESQSQETGEVLLFPRKNSEIWFPSDVPETALAGIISDCSFEKFAIEGIRLLQDFLSNERREVTQHIEFNSAYQSLLETSVKILTEAQQRKDLLIQVELLRQIEGKLSKFVSEWNKTFLFPPKGMVYERNNVIDANRMLSNFNKWLATFKQATIEKLCEEIRIKPPKNTNEISQLLQQFTFFHFVLPPINNERIRRQQGAFIIYPPGKTEHWKLENNVKPDRIQIAAEAKTKILEELSALGINRCYIFPELSELAADVKLRYPPTMD
ncbi:FRG domain-containing protein [Pectobacterium brasiliense]|uniref:FRG domain-containing protein n=1 Tax=Pectobacterium TaxID=122277 RepID=UPI001968C2F3|nr:FRG domain-containing protein [Pectobacterium brasiliense]MBN3114522.1 FRG domain-containing protein [Pectobacterium brasiliense]